MAKHERGFILIAAYMVIAVLIILGIAFISKSVTETKIARHEEGFIQALFLAEAGIDYALDQMRADNIPGNHFDNSLGAGAIGSYSCTWGLMAGETARWEIISTGTVDNLSRSLRAEVVEDTFARYLYFTDDEHFRWWWWKIPVWFITGDYLGGPFQSNSHLHIYGDPVYADPASHKPVKTEGDFITFYNNGNYLDTTETSTDYDEPDFQEGIELSAAGVPFPSQALDLRAAADQAEGYHFNATAQNPAEIVLNSDGTMTVTAQGHTDDTMSLPGNGAVFVSGGNVEVSGTLNGDLSIGSDRSIVIADDVVYNNPAADTLGLIAERDVVVGDDVPSHDYNGDSLGDVKIQASIMALGNSFVVEDWQGALKGTIMLFGGIIQNERGPVGTFDSDAGARESGYAKDYQHDSRLTENPPPFYPTTGDYVIVSWEE